MTQEVKFNNAENGQMATMLLLLLILTNKTNFSDRQLSMLREIIQTTPDNEKQTSLPSDAKDSETICGMAQLAKFIGTSIPTACKLSKAGKFDKARLDFGQKKFVWDKSILLEIARENRKK